MAAKVDHHVDLFERRHTRPVVLIAGQVDDLRTDDLWQVRPGNDRRRRVVETAYLRRWDDSQRRRRGHGNEVGGRTAQVDLESGLGRRPQTDRVTTHYTAKVVVGAGHIGEQGRQRRRPLRVEQRQP